MAAKPKSRVRGGSGSVRSSGGSKKRGAKAVPVVLTFHAAAPSEKREHPTPAPDDPFAFFS